MKPRRSPALIAAAVLLIAVSGLGFYWLYSTSGERVDVVAVATDVEYGETITAEDLVSTQVAVEPGVQVVRWSDRQTVIGSTATTRLMKGSLISSGQFSSRPVPAKGNSLLGVSVKPGMWPEGQLRPGDHITIMAASPTSDGGASADSSKRSINAVLVDSAPSSTTGTTTLIVEVLNEDAQALAGYASSGMVIVILDGPN